MADASSQSFVTVFFLLFGGPDFAAVPSYGPACPSGVEMPCPQLWQEAPDSLSNAKLGSLSEQMSGDASDDFGSMAFKFPGLVATRQEITKWHETERDRTKRKQIYY